MKTDTVIPFLLDQNVIERLPEQDKQQLEYSYDDKEILILHRKMTTEEEYYMIVDLYLYLKSKNLQFYHETDYEYDILHIEMTKEMKERVKNGEPPCEKIEVLKILGMINNTGEKKEYKTRMINALKYY